jgi:hypothetical protein
VAPPTTNRGKGAKRKGDHKRVGAAVKAAKSSMTSIDTINGIKEVFDSTSDDITNDTDNDNVGLRDEEQAYHDNTIASMKDDNDTYSHTDDDDDDDDGDDDATSSSTPTTPPSMSGGRKVKRRRRSISRSKPKNKATNTSSNATTHHFTTSNNIVIDSNDNGNDDSIKESINDSLTINTQTDNDNESINGIAAAIAAGMTDEALAARRERSRLDAAARRAKKKRLSSSHENDDYYEANHIHMNNNNNHPNYHDDENGDANDRDNGDGGDTPDALESPLGNSAPTSRSSSSSSHNRRLVISTVSTRSSLRRSENDAPNYDLHTNGSYSVTDTASSSPYSSDSYPDDLSDSHVPTATTRNFYAK